MKWFTKQSMHGIFAALVLLIAGLGALFYFQANRASVTGDLVLDSHKVMERVEVIFRQIKDAEGHVFNYVITGNENDRTHYQEIIAHEGHSDHEASYVESLDENLQQLYAEKAGDPEQQQRINQLQPLMLEEKKFLLHVMELREAQGVDAALEYIRNNDDEPIMTQVEAILLGLQAAENTLLGQRVIEDNRSDARNKQIVLGAFVLSLLVVVLTYSIILRSLARRRKAEEALHETSQWQHAILDNAPYAVIATNESGLIHIYNPAAQRMFGYSAAEMIGKQTPVLLHDPEELRQRTVELSARLERVVVAGFATLTANADLEGMEEYECTFLGKGGFQLPVLSSVTALKDISGKITGYLFIAKDITEQKRMERMKSEFISTVSHELRTPLTSIRGALGLVAGGAVGELSPKVAELVNIAHKNSERLVRIVNDILDAEKIGSGKVQLLMQQVDLPVLIRQSIEANQAYADKHKVKLVLERAPDSAMLTTDPDRLMQVMANLLSNAAKFSPEGAQVLIRIDETAGHLRISVEDHGPGVPEAFRSRIFEKFAQADGSAARGHEGTGLGLSITRKLVEAMGGTVGFTTETGKGSVFYVDLSVAQEEILPLETASDAPAKNRVLIVEDNVDNATLIKILLEQAGFGVDIAYTLAEARTKLAAQTYAAMTLDLTLPDGDGITLLREVRAQPVTHSLPIIVVSGKAEESKSALSGEAVALVDWLIKPIDELQLVRALRHAVSHDDEGLPRILHVEDDVDMSLVLREMLKDQAEIITATTLRKARSLLARQSFALIVLDLSLPDGSGMELLKTMNTAAKSTPVLILSASEASAEVRARVAGVLVKSRMSETKIVDTILALIHKASVAKQAA